MYTFSILALTALTSAIAVSPALAELTSIATSSTVVLNRHPVASSSAVSVGNISVRSPAASTATHRASSGYSRYPPACKKQLAIQRVEITKPIGHNGIRLDNVPLACMDVARSIMDNTTQIAGPMPQSIDIDSILFSDLSDKEYKFLSSIFDGWAASQVGLMKRHLESGDTV